MNNGTNGKSYGPQKRKNGRDTRALNTVNKLSNAELSTLMTTSHRSRSIISSVVSNAAEQVLKSHLPILGVSDASQEFANVLDYGVIGTSSMLKKFAEMPGITGMLSMAGGGNTTMMAPVVESINDIAPAIVKIMKDRGFIMSDKGAIILLAFCIIGGRKSMDIALSKALRFEGNRIWVKGPTLMSFLPEINKTFANLK
jgi:hypothetical protein